MADISKKCKIDLNDYRGDLMTEWKCSKCGFRLTADAPPDECPSCKQNCEFVNVTCYIPECQEAGADNRL